MNRYNELRRVLLCDILRKQAQPLILTGYPGVSPYLYKTVGGYALILVNTTVEVFGEIRFDIRNIPVGAIRAVGKDGQIREAAFTREGGTVVVKERLDYLSTCVLLLDVI
ncbi:MAG: hypothetical protein FWE62_06595 [Firmicutes bacterium]|nr:hypothetical protein [Bacillota bacterium]